MVAYQAFRQIQSRPKPPSKITKQPLTHKTRNQLIRKGPWVRIPPLPPENPPVAGFTGCWLFFFSSEQVPNHRASQQPKSASSCNPYHWARASALNLMGLAALNLHKGIASLCTPARQKSEVCDLAQGSLTSSFIGFYKNSRRTSCKRNSRCPRQAAWITGYVMGKTKPTNISADRLCLAYYSIFSRTQTGILCGFFSALQHGFLQLFRNNQRDASFRLRPDKDIGFILYAF